MGLTVEQGVQAGKMAGRIIRLSDDLAALDAAIEKGATLLQISAATDMGTFQSDNSMNAADTKSALLVMRGIVQANVDQLTAQLGKLGD